MLLYVQDTISNLLPHRKPFACTTRFLWGTFIFMAENKKSFIAYSDWDGMFQALPDEIAGKLIKHIFSYVNDRNPKSDDYIINALFEQVKSTLKRDLKKWEAQKEQRSLAGKKSAETRSTKSNDRSNSFNEKVRNPTVNVNVNDNVNVSVNEINNNKADADEINYLDVHQSFADRLLLNDLECQSIYEVSEKRVTFELLNTFVAHLTNQSKVYNHYSEFKKHFSNWMRKHEPNKSGAGKSKVDAYLENNLEAKKLLGI